MPIRVLLRLLREVSLRSLKSVPPLLHDGSSTSSETMSTSNEYTPHEGGLGWEAPAPGPPAPTPQSQNAAPRQLDQNAENIEHDANLLIESFLPPPYPPPSASQPKTAVLPQPFILPQLSNTFDSPYARGYSEALADLAGISREDFIAFVDGLNLAVIASPPLQVVNAVGMIIGIVYVLL